MKKIIVVFVSLLLCLLVLLIRARKQKDNIDTIKLSEVTHSVFYTPLYVAIENGYFKEENINLELTLTPGADKVASSVLSKDADIGFSGPEATIYIYNSRTGTTTVVQAANGLWGNQVDAFIASINAGSRAAKDYTFTAQ